MSEARRDRDLVVVIRTAGERTFEGCRDLVTAQVPGVEVHVVREQPFEAALRRSYEIGAASGAEWMMTLDADVLVRKGAVQELLTRAARMPERYFQFEGLVHDKLMGDYRRAGHRVYRTRFLSEALSKVPANGTRIRPEESTLLEMSAAGYPSDNCRVVVGVHDHEQFYRDIYRKALVHGQKHRGWLSSVVPWWQSISSQDADFIVAIRGFFDGYLDPTPLAIDVRLTEQRADTALREMELPEKAPLPPGAGDSEPFRGLHAALLEDALPQSPAARHVRVIAAFRRLGPARFLPYVTGSALSALGARLREVATRD